MKFAETVLVNAIVVVVLICITGDPVGTAGAAKELREATVNIFGK